MVRSYVILLSILIVTVFDTHAQIFLTSPNGATMRNVRYVPSGRMSSLNTETDVEIQGSPYLNDNYATGTFFLERGTFPDIQIRYNIYLDQMEFKQGDSVMAIGPDEIINKVFIGSQTFVIDKFEIKGKTFSTYIERLDSGHISLMGKWLVLFKEMERGKPIQGDIPPKYERMRNEYFIKVKQGPLVKVKNVKQLIEFLPSNKSQVEAFAEKERIRGNGQTDLRAIVQYYNTLHGI